MTTDTSIGSDDQDDSQQSGIEDEEQERKAREKSDLTRHDLTREDIESGNDRNTSADDLGRSGKTNKLDDDGIELGK